MDGVGELFLTGRERRRLRESVGENGSRLEKLAVFDKLTGAPVERHNGQAKTTALVSYREKHGRVAPTAARRLAKSVRDAGGILLSQIPR